MEITLHLPVPILVLILATVVFIATLFVGSWDDMSSKFILSLIFLVILVIAWIIMLFVYYDIVPAGKVETSSVTTTSRMELVHHA
jgi:hypothetical protein